MHSGFRSRTKDNYVTPIMYFSSIHSTKLLSNPRDRYRSVLNFVTLIDFYPACLCYIYLYKKVSHAIFVFTHRLVLVVFRTCSVIGGYCLSLCYELLSGTLSIYNQTLQSNTSVTLEWLLLFQLKCFAPNC